MMKSLFPKHKNPNYVSSILLILCSSFAVSLGTLSGKVLTSGVPFFPLLFIRFFVPTFILWWFALINGNAHIRWAHFRIHLMRSIYICLSQYALFYALTTTTMMDATLLYMTSPLFIPIMSRLMHGTAIPKKTWASIAVGFVGIALILKPDSHLFDWTALIGLSAGLFNGCSQVCLHRLSTASKTSGHDITLIFCTLSSALTFIPVMLTWVDIQPFQALAAVNPIDWLILLGFGFLVITNQTLKTRAFSKVKNAASLSPFIYVSIIITGLLDWLVYHHVPDVWSVAGALLVMFSGAMMLFLKAPSKKAPEAKATDVDPSIV